MNRDWYRNEEWNPEIRSEFFARLNRCRSEHNRQSALRIQALYLEQSHPEAALELVDLFFACTDRFFDAAGFCSRAIALLALGDLAGSMSAFKDALDAEVRNPQFMSLANLEWPLLVTSRRIGGEYVSAFDVLGRRTSSSSFTENFMWYGSRAMILHAAELPADAASCAAIALESVAHLSPEDLRRNRILLICGDYEDVLRRLRRISQGAAAPE